jgi:phosphoglycolate phosphatase
MLSFLPVSERAEAKPEGAGAAKFAADIIFFDNDGTIFNSETGVLVAVQDGFREFAKRRRLPHLEPPTIARIKQLTGQANTKFFPAVLPPELAHLAPELRDTCLKYETRAIREHGALYDGAAETLRELRARGKKLVLITHAGVEYFTATAERFGYSKLFDRLYHVGLHGLADKPQMIAHALDALSLDSAPLAAVGDKRADMEAGRAHGATTVYAAYGFGEPEDRELADFVIDSPSELLVLVE